MTQVDVNKREYFRVDDSISLKVERIEHSDEQTLFELFSEKRKAFATGNPFAAGDEDDLVEFSKLKQLYPEVAAYIARLEKRLARLAYFIDQDDGDFPSLPTHIVNISGNGIRFTHWEMLEKGTMVSLRFMLYPSLTRIMCFAKVLDYTVDQASDADRQYQIRAEFTHLVEEDRKLIVRHIHNLQLRALRNRKK